MNTQLPGNLAELFPLRLRLRGEMRFFRDGNLVVAERISDGARFSLRPWQYEVISRLDGRRTYEEAAREVYSRMAGCFTATGLLNFYNWMYQEDIVLCECESIFELVEDDPQWEDGTRSASQQPSRGPSILAARVRSAARHLHSWESRRQLIKVSAIVLGCLAMARLVYVASPLFEPPARRLHAEIDRALQPKPAGDVKESSETILADSSAEKVELAGRVPEPPAFAKGEESNSKTSAPTEEAVSDEILPEPTVVLAEPRPAKEDLIARIDALRQQLAECRIRRDEFYLQNDEAGYRHEVERMTELARQIGEFEAGL